MNSSVRNFGDVDSERMKNASAGHHERGEQLDHEAGRCRGVRGPHAGDEQHDDPGDRQPDEDHRPRALPCHQVSDSGDRGDDHAGERRPDGDLAGGDEDGEHAGEAEPDGQQRPAEGVGDEHADGARGVGVRQGGDDDADGDRQQAEHGQSTGAVLERHPATATERREPPHRPAEHGDQDAGAEEDAVDDVLLHAVAVEEAVEPGEGDHHSDRRGDQTLGVALLGAAVAQLEDTDGDQRHTGDEQDRPRHVAVLPQVVVADPRGGEDLAPEVVAVGLVQPFDDDLAGQQPGEARLGADQDEERAQRDDEAGQAGLVDHRPVEPADHHGEGERERDGDEQREPGTAELADLLGQEDARASRWHR